MEAWVVMGIKRPAERSYPEALSAGLDAAPSAFLPALQAFLAANLIRHFSAREVCPVGKRAGSVELQPAPVGLWENIIPTLHVAEWARSQMGTSLVVNSAYRDPDYNRAVGGAPGSMHKHFNALDLAPVGADPVALWQCLNDFPDAQYLGIGRYSSFVHVDTRGFVGMWDKPEPARWQG